MQVGKWGMRRVANREEPAVAVTLAFVVVLFVFVLKAEADADAVARLVGEEDGEEEREAVLELECFWNNECTDCGNNTRISMCPFLCFLLFPISTGVE